MRKILTTSLHIACIFLGILAYTVCADDVTEDAANTGFHLLEEPINPHFIAMGFTGTALAGKGFSFYNPALPFTMDRTYLSVEYGQHPKAGLKHTQLEAAVTLENWFFGLSLHSESIEDIFETNVWGWLPFYDAPFSAQFTNISFDVGFTQWEDFAFAVCINGMQDRIHNEYAYAFSVSAGAVYSPILNHLTFGLSILNIGTSTPMLGPDTADAWGNGEDLPFNSRFGVAWNDTIKNIPYMVALDIVYRNVRDKSDRFTKHIKERFTVPVGVEIRPLPPLAVRIGKRFNFPTEVLNFGIGLMLDPLSVDASFVVPKLVDDAEIKWLTSITYYLRKKERKKQIKKIVIEKPLIISPHDTLSDSTSGIKKDMPDSSTQAPIEEIDSAVIDSKISDSTESSLVPIDSVSSDTSHADTFPEQGDDALSQSKPAPVEEVVEEYQETSEMPPDTIGIITHPAEDKSVEVPLQDTTQNQ